MSRAYQRNKAHMQNSGDAGEGGSGRRRANVRDATAHHTAHAPPQHFSLSDMFFFEQLMQTVGPAEAKDWLKKTVRGCGVARGGGKGGSVCACG